MANADDNHAEDRGAPGIDAIERGIAAIEPAPADGGVLGVSTLRDDDAEIVLAAMGRLLGTSDIKALLRRGSCTLCRAEPRAG